MSDAKEASELGEISHWLRIELIERCGFIVPRELIAELDAKIKAAATSRVVGEKDIKEAAESYPALYELMYMNADTPRLSGAEYLSFGFKKGAEYVLAHIQAKLGDKKDGE